MSGLIITDKVCGGSPKQERDRGVPKNNFDVFSKFRQMYDRRLLFLSIIYKFPVKKKFECAPGIHPPLFLSRND